MRVARYADLTAAPWKNGGGVTRQVVVSPPEAGLSDFHWRVSMAVVGSDGPFSMFPDVDRMLWLLSGGGVELLRQDGSRDVLHPGQRLDFSAEESIIARLLGGPVEDLNVMTDRRFAHAAAHEQRLDGEALFDFPGEWSVVVVRKGYAVVSTMPGVPRLEYRDCLVMDGPCKTALLSGHADLIVISFDRPAPGWDSPA
jgi:environmental stress-induced protein Ves